MSKWIGITALASMAILLGACQTTVSEREQAIRAGTQGASVNSICFSRNIRNWYALDDQSLIVERGRGNYYKLDLVGGCDPSQAFLTLRTESRSGICLSPGDQISFPQDRGFSCTITRIHEWIPADPEELEILREEASGN